MLLGLGTTAIYLLPAVFQRDAVSLRVVHTSSFFDYRKWFLGADIHSILDYKMRVLVVTISMIAASAAGFCLSRWVQNNGANRTRMLFWLGISALSLFFMTSASGFFWRTIQPLAAVEFPIRFNAILTLAIAALWAGAAPAIPGNRSRWAVLLACGFGVLWLAGTEWAASRAFLVWRSDPKGLERLQDSERFSRDHENFLPQWAMSAQRHGIEAPLAKLPGHGLLLESAGRGFTAGRASIMSWEPRRAVLNVETPEPANLLIGQFYYPGWRAQDLTDDRPLTLSPSAVDGLLLVEVPAGTHQILLRLEAQAPERAGLAVSMISCLVAIVLSIVTFRGAYRRRPALES
jgi:hypothetical protein